MITRRTFLKFSSVGVLTLYTLNELGVEEAIAAIPGGTLPPGAVPKFVTSLVKPPAMPTSDAGHYSIAVRQFSQQILPAPLPPTTVWSYGSTTDASTFNYPAFTIEATRGTPTTVTWTNELRNGDGKFLPHLLPVDPTLHPDAPFAGGGFRRADRKSTGLACSSGSMPRSLRRMIRRHPNSSSCPRYRC